MEVKSKGHDICQRLRIKELSTQNSISSENIFWEWRGNQNKEKLREFVAMRPFLFQIRASRFFSLNYEIMWNYMKNMSLPLSHALKHYIFVYIIKCALYINVVCMYINKLVINRYRWHPEKYLMRKLYGRGSLEVTVLINSLGRFNKRWI